VALVLLAPFISAVSAATAAAAAAAIKKRGTISHAGLCTSRFVIWQQLRRLIIKQRGSVPRALCTREVLASERPDRDRDLAGPPMEVEVDAETKCGASPPRIRAPVCWSAFILATCSAVAAGRLRGQEAGPLLAS
jgi:hypothetical protein